MRRASGQSNNYKGKGVKKGIEQNKTNRTEKLTAASACRKRTPEQLFLILSHELEDATAVVYASVITVLVCGR